MNLSAWDRLRRWLRLDTDGDGDAPERIDEDRLDAAEREMERRLADAEARVAALGVRVDVVARRTGGGAA